tara:strand:- start:913 stop:1287 length:375 start_codon:yes stop_codon:yes gene_type:complete
MNDPLLKNKRRSKKHKKNKLSKKTDASYSKLYTEADIPEYPGWHPLHVAAFEGDFELASRLIKEGAYVSAIDLWGRTPLHYARRRKYGAVNDKIARLLIKNGADDFSPVDKQGRTPSDIYIQYS